jgi:hypothetical protein
VKWVGHVERMREMKMHTIFWLEMWSEEITRKTQG